MYQEPNKLSSKKKIEITVLIIAILIKEHGLDINGIWNWVEKISGAITIFNSLALLMNSSKLSSLEALKEYLEIEVIENE